ncbi:mechanosensitive ion channel [Polymorphobacter arshaanensis]|uniref:Mechanosensitive ion channel n=1 Tax=Glacieibacterium arshaanense TaxID=2511025 RepID=A0A4Y9ELY8_9SPHN|nr:mechanosensitive ion channel family protein [Polymorphobacter arshaanensis]TFU01476.1 mechanosensitive ion channel [Polymorphobacter arshaanensis]
MTVPAVPKPAAKPADSGLTDDLYDLPKQLHDVSETVYHWFRTDSMNALVAFGTGFGLFAIFYVLRWLLARLLGTEEKVTSWRGFARRLLDQTSAFFMAALAARIVIRFITPPEAVAGVITVIFTIALVFQAAVWARALILAMVERKGAEDDEDAQALASAMGIITILVNVVVWTLAIILVLDNLGINVTALVAGLGVGGIAIGLAAQGIFSDLFAALSILFDRPFRAGDTISFGTVTGTVEAIGLKTTRIRALSGEQVVVSNKNLLDMQISNLRRIEARRVVMTLNLALDTPAAKLALVPDMAEAAVKGRPHCRFERAHITRVTLDACEVEIVFHTDVADYVVFMDARQGVTLALIKELAAQGIDLAERLPTPS